MNLRKIASVRHYLRHYPRKCDEPSNCTKTYSGFGINEYCSTLRGICACFYVPSCLLFCYAFSLDTLPSIPFWRTREGRNGNSTTVNSSDMA